MPATIYRIQNFLATPSSSIYPDFFFIDTSFLINSLLPVLLPGIPTTKNKQCGDFLQVLEAKAKKNEVALYTCDNVINEFFNYILKKSVEQNDLSNPPLNSHQTLYQTNKRSPIVQIFKDHPDLVTKYYPVIEYYYRYLLSIPLAILDHDLLKSSGLGITDKMSELIRDFQIMPADALNIATAWKVGIKDILAIDFDYHRVDGINIYTSLGKQIKICRCP